MNHRESLPAPQSRKTHRVVMLGYPQAQILDITGPMEVFARTARWLRDHRGIHPAAYTVELVAAGAGPIETSGGLSLIARAFRQVLGATPVEYRSRFAGP